MAKTGTRAAAAPAAPAPSATGLKLDPNDPDDAKIMDRQRKTARESGRTGGKRDAFAHRPDLAAAFDEGAAAADDDGQDDDGQAAAKPTAKATGIPGGSWTPTLTPPRRAHDAGGLAFGLLLYTAAITYIRYGPAGWKGWLSAKFLNKPLQGLPKSAVPGGPPPPHGSGRMDV